MMIVLMANMTLLTFHVIADKVDASDFPQFEDLQRLLIISEDKRDVGGCAWLL